MPVSAGRQGGWSGILLCVGMALGKYSLKGHECGPPRPPTTWQNSVEHRIWSVLGVSKTPRLPFFPNLPSFGYFWLTDALVEVVEQDRERQGRSTYQGTYWWGGFRALVSFSFSAWMAMPSGPLAHVCRTDQVRPALVAHASAT